MDTQRTMAFIRLIVLLYAVLNSTLLTMGYNPIPFTDEEVTTMITAVLAFGSAILAWWKNNNVTRSAQKAQVTLDRMKEQKKR